MSRPRSRFSTRFWLLAVLIAWAGWCLHGVALAGETDTLKLMVTTCTGTPLDHALVEVVHYRPGTGEIDSDWGYTDEGYLEFTLSDLEADDQARVSVTPSGGTESSHVYYWLGSASEKPCLWDIGGPAPDYCEDGWYDESEGILQCRCQ